MLNYLTVAALGCCCDTTDERDRWCRAGLLTVGWVSTAFLRMHVTALVKVSKHRSIWSVKPYNKPPIHWATEKSQLSVQILCNLILVQFLFFFPPCLWASPLGVFFDIKSHKRDAELCVKWHLSTLMTLNKLSLLLCFYSLLLNVLWNHTLSLTLM